MSMLYADIKVGMEVDFKIQTGKKGKRVRTEEDPFAPVSRTQGSGSVIFAGKHIVTIQMQDGYKVTIEKVMLTRMKTAMIRQKNVSHAGCLFQPISVP